MDSFSVLLKIAENHFDKTTELAWLKKKLEVFKGDFKDRNFYLSFSSCPRFIAKSPINFSASELEELNAIYPNFSKSLWSKDEIARILLMVALPTANNQRILKALTDTADYREQIALYKGLYFLENAADFTLQCREGMRTNMVGIFDAIALYNPFPAKYLKEAGWNQMVLKTVFMDRPVYKIHQIEQRKNKTLALIFLDYVHERWAAHRKVTPELWRFISGFVDDTFIKEIQKTALSTDQLEQFAAIKALTESDYPEGHQWLKDNGLSNEALPSWNDIGAQIEKAKQA
jgi:hypothetical protein